MVLLYQVKCMQLLQIIHRHGRVSTLCYIVPNLIQSHYKSYIIVCFGDLQETGSDREAMSQVMIACE